MRKTHREAAAETLPSHVPGGVQYAIDLGQRLALALQAFVARGDQLLEDERAGLPLRLAFPYETVLDASRFDEPAGYSLLRILPEGGPDARRGDARRPVIVFDPRAGHGPGIGASRSESEVGMALRRGHPTYFVAHHMTPCAGQTLARVHHALRRFVAEVSQRHPGQQPTLYGNCQAGWAVALLAADCTGVTGPIVLNGAPLSYWGGEPGVNPMRLAGGLTGGVWASRLMADLAGGQFDGAWLVQNFEQLDPGHAWFGKYRALLADPQGERERFLHFERWWGEFCFLAREEMVDIVENLFIGNRLEEGGFRICDCCHADLRRLKSPMLVFASGGDNITPPVQALAWVPAVWASTADLVASGQRICYLLHPSVGHLGIFVSAAVARREHDAILANLDALDALAPGLYEMKIGQDEAGSRRGPSARVSFHPRRVEDLPRPRDTAGFEAVRAQSELLDAWYQQTVGRAARLIGQVPGMTAWMKAMHPMRTSRLGWAHAFNPFAALIDATAAGANAFRLPLSRDNPWMSGETAALDALGVAFEAWRRVRDGACEDLFALLYEVPTARTPGD